MCIWWLVKPCQCWSISPFISRSCHAYFCCQPICAVLCTEQHGRYSSLCHFLMDTNRLQTELYMLAHDGWLLIVICYKSMKAAWMQLLKKENQELCFQDERNKTDTMFSLSFLMVGLVLPVVMKQPHGTPSIRLDLLIVVIPFHKKEWNILMTTFLQQMHSAPITSSIEG